MMFARLNVSTFLACCSGDLSDNESEEKIYVAICGGSICILTEIHLNLPEPRGVGPVGGPGYPSCSQFCSQPPGSSG